MVYTTALFSDAHVVNRSQTGNEVDSEEREDVPRVVFGAGTGTGSEDIVKAQKLN